MPAALPSTDATFRGSHQTYAPINRVGSVDYRAKEFTANHESHKQSQRESVLAFIREHHAGDQLRFLGLPGPRWRMEHMLAEHWEDSTFAGFEWDWNTISKNASWMPGGSPRLCNFRMNSGTVEAMETDRAVWLGCHAGQFMSLGMISRNVITKSKRHRLRRLAMRCTAFWLDFTGNVCGDARNAINHLGEFLSRDASVVPGAITVAACRERADRNVSHSWRVSEIERLLIGCGLRAPVTKDTRVTHSEGGVPMLTWYGLMVPIQEAK